LCLGSSCAQYGEGEVDEVDFCSERLLKTVAGLKFGLVLGVLGVEALGLVDDEEIAQTRRLKPVRRVKPAAVKGGVVVACPHSGRFYPPELLSASRLDRHSLRRSEDAFVDLLFQDAPIHGANLLTNEFARAFVDVNRSPGELDPKLVLDLSLLELESTSERVKAGLGVIPRTVGDGLAIYTHHITRQQALARLDEVHLPWHAELEGCLLEATEANSAAILLDCHSMPGHAAGEPMCDVILGDLFGSSCAPIVTSEVLAFLQAAGLKVARNNPYAGGYTTRRYGQPLRHHHALQIEINRSIYMVEGGMTVRPAFSDIRKIMADLVHLLVDLSILLAPVECKR
jgi:N-formylglutamate amidohydrolase